VAERSAGIVLAGGRSRRMGSPKAMLEWHGSTLVRRAAGLVARAVDGPVVVVRAAGQGLPALPEEVEIADDPVEDRGPLVGMAAGLAAIGDRADVVFVAGVDAPLLHPAFVAHVVRSLRPGDDVALPRAGGFDHHLAAAYRARTLSAALAEQIESDRLKASELVARLRAVELDAAALLADALVAALDPELDSLLNLNDAGAYDAARARPAPRVRVRLGSAAPARSVDAATVGGAAVAAGAPAGATCVLDGRGPVTDPSEPLAAGDTLTFEAAAELS
jgi:molybdopterin-guanine dinucleotide biosynthesis protein A